MIMELGYYTHTLGGHRKAYLEFIKEQFGGIRISQKKIISWESPVIFLMIEENFFLYILTGIIRNFFGRRTIGLLFRPGPASKALTVKLQVKRLLLKFLCKLPSVRTISIVPTILDPKIESIANDWIFDFQLWDLTNEELSHYKILKEKFQKTQIIPSSEADQINKIDGLTFFERIKIFAAGRSILVSLGIQNKNKGLELLTQKLTSNNSKDWVILICGKFDFDTNKLKSTIESHGALIIDRFLSESELSEAYAVADAVWCLYDPSYDQASGILGRAIQFGIPPIVRTDSISEKLCSKFNITHVTATDQEDLRCALNFLHANKDIKSDHSIAIKHFKEESILKLKNAIYGSTESFPPEGC